MIYGSFFERLEQRCLAANSLLCVGLDPHRELPGAADQARLHGPAHARH